MEVRRLQPAEWKVLRDVRLRALADAPYAFSSPLEREQRFTRADWQQRAGADANGSVFVAFDDDRVVAMAGGFFPAAERTSATVWGMWVEPAARGAGLGRWLLEEVAEWAREHGARRLDLAVTDTPEARRAAALYRAAGFVATGADEPLESDPRLMTRGLARVLSSP